MGSDLTGSHQMFLAHPCYVPEEDRHDVKELPNVLGIDDDILIVGFDNDDAHHERTVLEYYRHVEKEV